MGVKLALMARRILVQRLHPWDVDRKISGAPSKHRRSIFHVSCIGRMGPVRHTFASMPGNKDRPWQFATDALLILLAVAYWRER